MALILIFSPLSTLAMKCNTKGSANGFVVKKLKVMNSRVSLISLKTDQLRSLVFHCHRGTYSLLITALFLSFLCSSQTGDSPQRFVPADFLTAPRQMCLRLSPLHRWHLPALLTDPCGLIIIWGKDAAKFFKLQWTLFKLVCHSPRLKNPSVHLSFLTRCPQQQIHVSGSPDSQSEASCWKLLYFFLDS